MSFFPILRWLIDRSTEEAVPDEERPPLIEWWEGVRAVRRPEWASIDQATAGGFLAGCVGYAFAGGYRSALEALVPGLDPEPLVALCITEEGGNHPKAIRTVLEPAGAGEGAPWRLSGRKTYVTLGGAAKVLLVAAVIGHDPQGRNRLRMARISSQAPGVRIQPLPPLPIVPEIPHAALELDGVPVDDAALLPGDGYDRYVKPFRTIEDVHVNAALLGYLYRMAARYGWPRDTREELLATLVQLRSIALADPSAPETHIALGGFFSILERLLEAIHPHWELVEEAVAEAWRRDAALRMVAGRARAQRLEKAWEAARTETPVARAGR